MLRGNFECTFMHKHLVSFTPLMPTFVKFRPNTLFSSLKFVSSSYKFKGIDCLCYIIVGDEYALNAKDGSTFDSSCYGRLQKFAFDWLDYT